MKYSQSEEIESPIENELTLNFPHLLNGLMKIFSPDTLLEWELVEKEAINERNSQRTAEVKQYLQLKDSPIELKISKKINTYTLTLRKTDQQYFSAPNLEILKTHLKIDFKTILPSPILDLYHSLATPGINFSWNSSTNSYELYSELVFEDREIFGFKIDKIVIPFYLSNDHVGKNYIDAGLVIQIGETEFKGKMPAEGLHWQLTGKSEWKSPKNIYSFLEPLIRGKLPDWMAIKEKFPSIDKLEGFITPQDAQWQFNIKNNKTAWKLYEIKNIVFQLNTFSLKVEKNRDSISTEFKSQLQIGNIVIDCKLGNENSLSGSFSKKELMALIRLSTFQAILKNTTVINIISSLDHLAYKFEKNRLEFSSENSTLVVHKEEKSNRWITRFKINNFFIPPKLLAFENDSTSELRKFNDAIEFLKDTSSSLPIKDTSFSFVSSPIEINFNFVLSIHPILNQLFKISMEELNLPVTLTHNESKTQLRIPDFTFKGDLDLKVINLRASSLKFNLSNLKHPVIILSSKLDIDIAQLFGYLEIGLNPFKFRSQFKLTDQIIKILGLKITNISAELEFQREPQVGLSAKFSVQQDYEDKYNANQVGKIRARFGGGILTQFTAKLPEYRELDIKSLMEFLTPLENRDDTFKDRVRAVKEVFPASLSYIKDEEFFRLLSEKSETDPVIKELLPKSRRLIVKIDRVKATAQILGQLDIYGLCAFLMLDIDISSHVKIIGGAKSVDLFRGLIKIRKSVVSEMKMTSAPPIQIEGPLLYAYLNFSEILNFNIHFNASLTFLEVQTESQIAISPHGLFLFFSLQSAHKYIKFHEKIKLEVTSNQFNFETSATLFLAIELANHKIDLTDIKTQIKLEYVKSQITVQLAVHLDGVDVNLNTSIPSDAPSLEDIISIMQQKIIYKIQDKLTSLNQGRLEEILKQYTNQAKTIAKDVHRFGQQSLHLAGQGLRMVGNSTETVIRKSQSIAQPIWSSTKDITHKTGQFLTENKHKPLESVTHGTRQLTQATESFAHQLSSHVEPIVRKPMSFLPSPPSIPQVESVKKGLEKTKAIFGKGLLF